ncbi:hypothetical protein COV24_02250 [candidate division WWE3 bacterium CG10_big_fil_rev_8_21_14_0_10_32_10]|uniref:Uncharacterized protein n=1 Tax=candidate division WWE3 bacterium CG10_big_fil_rev_8_21_14_0_10_32_10 TaxID=1975090 RepID=A0A2H0RAP1_UNCKA|nr:MAG: hypothetical protein COV24_02250 [candidate division WWE3 bacterium CG10_big_fil_rev_8_21_14_0_10_32_10]
MHYPSIFKFAEDVAYEYTHSNNGISCGFLDEQEFIQHLNGNPTAIKKRYKGYFDIEIPFLNSVTGEVVTKPLSWPGWAHFSKYRSPILDISPLYDWINFELRKLRVLLNTDITEYRKTKMKSLIKNPVFYMPESQASILSFYGVNTDRDNCACNVSCNIFIGDTSYTDNILKVMDVFIKKGIQPVCEIGHYKIFCINYIALIVYLAIIGDYKTHVIQDTQSNTVKHIVSYYLPHVCPGKHNAYYMFLTSTNKSSRNFLLSKIINCAQVSPSVCPENLDNHFVSNKYGLSTEGLVGNLNVYLCDFAYDEVTNVL